MVVLAVSFKDYIYYSGPFLEYKFSSNLTSPAVSFRPCIPKYKMQNFYKSLAWCIKGSRKINRIIKMDCKLRDKSNEPN